MVLIKKKCTTKINSTKIDYCRRSSPPGSCADLLVISLKTCNSSYDWSLFPARFLRKTFFRHAAFAFRCGVDLGAWDLSEWDAKNEPTYLQVSHWSII